MAKFDINSSDNESNDSSEVRVESDESELLCKKQHKIIDYADGYGKTKCLDCAKIYNRFNEIHCCCRCDTCHKRFLYPDREHLCTVTHPNFCRKHHRSITLSFDLFKCMDCERIFNYHQDHCCCICTECKSIYGDPFEGHKCGNITLNPIFCRKPYHNYTIIDRGELGEDGENEVKCNECDVIYDNRYQHHCCCKCWECEMNITILSLNTIAMH